MTTGLSELASRHSRAGSSVVRSLVRDIEFFLKLRAVDPEMSLVRARRVVERAARTLHATCIHPEKAKGEDLHRVIEDLRRDGVVNRVVYSQLMMLKEMGNFGAHGDPLAADAVHLSDRDLDLCEQALAITFRAFLESLKESEHPEASVSRSLETLRGSRLDAGQLAGIPRLSRTAYGRDTVLPLELIEGWYERNPDIYLTVIDTTCGEIVGVLSAIPLTPEAFSRTLEPSFDERTIRPGEIRSFDTPDFYHLYLCSIVADPSYRRVSTIFKKLYDGYLKFLLELADNDIFIVELSADAVTDQGKRICHSLQMSPRQETGRGSTIYHTTMLPPAFQVTSTYGLRLIRFYKRKYEEVRELLG